MKCKNHEDIDAVARCTGCQEVFCENCLVEMNGKKYCGDCKIMAVRENPVFEFKSKEISCKEANDALKYALLGIFLFVIEPMAIVEALKAKERLKEDTNLIGEVKANVALIIGIIVYAIGILFVIINIIENLIKNFITSL